MIRTTGLLHTGRVLALILVTLLVTEMQPAHSAPARVQNGTTSYTVFLPLVRTSYEFVERAPNPQQVTPVLDGARAAHATIDASGGVVSAVGADGTRFTLTIPPDALAVAQEITMTPLSAVGNLPFGGGLAAGVDLAPNGLQFYVPGTLTITPATPVAPAEETPFAYRTLPSGASELYLEPLQRHTPAVVFNIMHFSGYGIARGSDAERATQQQRAPTTIEDQLRQQISALLQPERVAEVLGATPDANVLAKLTQLMSSYFASVIAPTLAPLRTDCGFYDLYMPRALSWQSQILILGANDGRFDLAFDEITRSLIEGLNNCFETSTHPCINRQDSGQMGRIARYRHQMIMLGTHEDDPRFNLDQYPQCTCAQLASVATWQGTITYTYSGQGSGGEQSVSIQEQGQATVVLAQPTASNGVTHWTASSISGNGQVHDTYVASSHDTRTVVGSGAFVPIATDGSGASLNVYSTSCSYDLYLKVAVPAVYTAFGSSSNGTAGSGLSLQGIPMASTDQSLSGSLTVPAIWLAETRGLTQWFAAGQYMHELETIVGQGNTGYATITWNLTPAP